MSAVNTIDWTEFWDSKAAAENDFRATGRGGMDSVGFLFTIREIARILDLGPQDRLLDIGCGTGIVSLALAPMVKLVHGIDLSPKMIARAQDNCAGCNEISFSVGAIDAPEVVDGAYDKALAYSVLQYLADEADVRSAFAALYRLLPPGGKAFYGANPDPERRQAYFDVIQNSNTSGEEKQRALEITGKTLWLDPGRAEMLAREAGLEAEARPINPRIWQHFYMYDLVLGKPL